MENGKKYLYLRLLWLILVTLSWGCATLYNPATGKDEFIFIDSHTESAIGKSTAQKLLRKYPASDNQRLWERVKAIGERIARVAERRDIVYTFVVLKDEELNALTLPGGYIYVNKGLMEILSDDELAFVLGHEVGHTSARHVVKKIQSKMAYQLLLAIAFVSVGEKTESARDIAQGVDMVYSLIELSYSRKDEYEADRLAVKYAFASGFNPYAALSALEKIKKTEGQNWKVLRYFRTHPFVDERINALKAIIPEVTAKSNRYLY